MLQRLFGTRAKGEPLPEPLKTLVANPDDSDALAAVRLAIRKALSSDPTLESDVRAMLAEAPGVTQQINAGANANTAGRDQVIINNFMGGPKAAMVPQFLPRDVPDFTGRENELAELTDLATHQSLKIALINGAAGVGKTALAIHAGHLLLPQFPDGQLYADLHGYTDGQEPAKPSEVLVAFLQQLGVEKADIPSQVEQQSGLLRHQLASKRVLMLLDNAATEAQVRLILPGTGSSLVLITSRTSLTGLDIDRRIDLGALSSAEAAALLAKVIGQTRTDSEPDATDHVRDWCGHLPLALRIAGQLLAAHKTWPVARLEYMLSDERQRLDLLEAGDLQVRTAFQVSYRQLADTDALMFCLLGLLREPTIGIAIAASLAGIHTQMAETILERLATAHLITENEHGHFEIHDLIRLFARETCLTMTDGYGKALMLPTPLARLYCMAMHADINVTEHYDSYELWPDDQTAAIVSYDGIVILSPSLEDDDLRADILAFATAVCGSIVVGDTAPEGWIAAPEGWVAIGRERLPEPQKGPGRVARLFAEKCGRDAASFTFSIRTGPRD